ncbi:MAG: TetR family transcriptional regulator [Alphaproteobacteria bacterium]|nr:MAG: TetR family transcriptional regulator [Alphaproteobacteria bacterium]
MQMKSSRRSNGDRSAEMRLRLVAAARRLFVAQGYDATSTPAIVAEAGVTRGALYHHFPDKRAIFHAVVMAEAEAVAGDIGAADQAGMSALERLLAGSSAYIQAMREAGRVRLLLVDGPAVLERETLRQIEAQHGDASLKAGVEEAMAAGDLPILPVEPLVSLLSAMFERAAMDVADGMAASDILVVIERLVGGLATPKGRAR